MSRRKQGRPQQRKTLDSLEQEKDLLVCGDCQTSFPLHDIVHFIKHKRQCCDKENLDSGGCRKDVGGNDRDDKGGDNAMEADSGDEETSASRRSKHGEGGDDDDDDEEEEEEDDDDDDDEDEADDGDGSRSRPAVNGDAGDEKSSRGDVEKKRRRTDDGRPPSRHREERRPLKQKQVVDAESNTTHSEPSRFECETCRSTYTSAWGLLQHAQKEHGMKIYTSPSSSSSSSSSGHSHTSTTTVLNNISPIDLAMKASSKAALDRRNASSTGCAGSVSPFPVHAPNPFTSPFRLPMDGRLPHPSSLSPFSRGPTLDFDLISDTRLRPQFLGRGIPGLDPSTFSPSPFDRSRAPIPHSLESQYDYYSMRLKQLAGSPVLTHSKPFLNPTQAQVATSSLAPNPTKVQSPPVETPASSSSSSPRLSSLSSALAVPQKLKSCEFCGKSFRFQSNLVVHRRSHTGEKPFKCPKCPHACTQQSKLKRHMKTHSTKNQNADGGTSPGGTPIDVKEEDLEDGEEDEEEEEEELEEMEGEEEEEDIVEEEMNDEEREVLESMRAAKRDENRPDAEPGEILHEAKGIKREHSNDKLGGDDDSEPSDLSMKKPKQTESLLSEVMKNSGLNSIPNYSEAFKAALAESQENEKNRDLDKVSVKSEDKNGDRTPRPPSPKSPKREKESEKVPAKSDENERAFFGTADLLGKSGKNSASPASVWNAAVESLAANPIESAASMYSQLHHPWFHPDSPVRLFYQPGYPGRIPSARDLSLSRENHGLNLSPTTTTSALSTTSPNLPTIFKASTNNRGSSSAGNSPTTSLLLPSNGGSNAITPLKKDRRNDTCEYCGKVFKNCSNLTVHRRSHTGEKPYKCTLCSYACAQSSKLTRHMKTHGRVGKDVYSCKFCNMPFSVPSTLEKHMRKCVENRQARILADGGPDLSSEASNGDIQESFSQPHLSA